MGDRRLMLVAVLVAACSVPPPPEPIRPEPPPAPPGSCATACNHLRELGCEEGQPTPGGAICEEVCADGMADRYRLGCVADLDACEDIEDCRR